MPLLSFGRQPLFHHIIPSFFLCSHVVFSRRLRTKITKGAVPFQLLVFFFYNWRKWKVVFVHFQKCSCYHGHFTNKSWAGSGVGRPHVSRQAIASRLEPRAENRPPPAESLGSFSGNEVFVKCVTIRNGLSVGTLRLFLRKKSELLERILWAACGRCAGKNYVCGQLWRLWKIRENCGYRADSTLCKKIVFKNLKCQLEKKKVEQLRNCNDNLQFNGFVCIPSSTTHQFWQKRQSLLYLFALGNTLFDRTEIPDGRIFNERFFQNSAIFCNWFITTISRTSSTGFFAAKFVFFCFFDYSNNTFCCKYTKFLKIFVGVT